MTVINTNINALRAQNASRVANKALGTAMERLSSGKRINGAKDDAAGMAISTRMDARVRSMTQAIRNSNDGISVTQIADSALGEIANILVQLRELAIQAASGTLSDVDRDAINRVSSEYVDQIDDISYRTEFNDKQLFGGDYVYGDGLIIHTGIDRDENLRIDMEEMSANALYIESLSYYDEGAANTTLYYIKNAMDVVAAQRANVAAFQNRLETNVNHLTAAVTNMTEAKSRIVDADFAVESTKLATAQVLAQASTAMLAQANQNQQDVLNLLR